MLPTISIIFPTQNGKKLIAQVLDSIKNQNYPGEKIEVIVIDNASTDGTAETVQKDFPWVKLIRLSRNTGSAYPITLGAKNAKGDYILATNDDVIFDKNCLRQLVKPAASDPKIGITTGKMLDLKPPHRQYVFGFRTNPYLGYHPYDFSNADKIRECDWTAGACIFIKKKLLKQINYFDDQYFFCGDDHDVCFQVKAHGYKIMYTPEAIYYHGFTRAKGQKGPSQANLFAHYRGKFRYALKNLTPLQIITTLLAQITIGPIFTYLFFRNKTLFPTLRGLKWNLDHFQETMKARHKAKTRAEQFNPSPISPTPIISPFLISLLISLIFGLPHLLIPYFLGNSSHYQPLAIAKVPLLTFEETWSYAAQVREVYDGRFLVSDYHLYEYKNSPPSLLFLSPFLLGNLARLVGSVKTAFIISDFLLPPLIFIVVYFFLLKLTNDSLIGNLGGILVLTANRLFQFIPPLNAEMAKALWKIFIVDGKETNPLEFSRLFHPQLVFLFLILHLYFLFLALAGKPSTVRGVLRTPIRLSSRPKPRRCFNRSAKLALLIASSALFLGSLFYSYFYYWTFALAGGAILFSVFLFKNDLPRAKTLALIITIALFLSIPYWIWFFDFKSLPGSTDVLGRMGLEVGRFRNFARTAQYLVFAFIFFRLIKKKNLSFWFLLAFLLGGIVCLNIQLLTGYTIQSWHWTIRAINPLSVIMIAYLFQKVILPKKKTPRNPSRKGTRSPRDFSSCEAAPPAGGDSSECGRSGDLKEAILAALILIFLLRGLVLHAVVAKNSYQGYTLAKTTLEAFAWLNQNTANDSVVLTPSLETTQLIPVYTHNNVFLPNGAATLASDKEILNRLLTAYKIFNLKESDLEKILTYSGSGPCKEIQNRPGGDCLVDSDLLEQQAVTVLFALKYLKKSENPFSWSVVFELPKEIRQEIISDYKELLKTPLILPSDFRLDYIFLGPAERKIIKEINFPQDDFVKEVFRNQDVIIYKVVS